MIDILLAPSHLLEHIYMEGILGYDALHVVSLNWVVLLGIVVGAVFTYFTFSRRKWRYKTMTVIAFSAITLYLLYFYFGIDYALPKETLFVPLFLRSFGYVIIAICFLTVLSGEDGQEKVATELAIYPETPIFASRIRINRKEESDMARPIKETPILYGEDARKFSERMKNPPKETKEERERRLKDYEAALKMLKV